MSQAEHNNPILQPHTPQPLCSNTLKHPAHQTRRASRSASSVVTSIATSPGVQRPQCVISGLQKQAMCVSLGGGFNPRIISPSDIQSPLTAIEHLHSQKLRILHLLLRPLRGTRLNLLVLMRLAGNPSFEQFRLRHPAKRQLLILKLGTFVTRLPDGSRCTMNNPHPRVTFVDVLPTVAAATKCLDHTVSQGHGEQQLTGICLIRGNHPSPVPRSAPPTPRRNRCHDIRRSTATSSTRTCCRQHLPYAGRCRSTPARHGSSVQCAAVCSSAQCRSSVSAKSAPSPASHQAARRSAAVTGVYVAT